MVVLNMGWGQGPCFPNPVAWLGVVFPALFSGSHPKTPMKMRFNSDGSLLSLLFVLFFETGFTYPSLTTNLLRSQQWPCAPILPLLPEC